MDYISVLLRTRQAMGGSLTFRESLSQRLNIIRPSRDQVQLEEACSYIVYRSVAVILMQIEKFKSLHTPDTILTPDVQ